MDTTSLIGSCGAVGVSITLLPTLLLIISEVLGVSRGKSNGIIHFIFCIIEKIKKKEPITEDEIFECLKKVQDTTDQVSSAVENITDAVNDLESQKTQE